MNLAKAIAITSKAFEEVTDKSGKPYILHCLWVMDRVRHLGNDYMMAAVMHDLIEDTDERSEINWTLDLLEDEGFPYEVVKALLYLTHDFDVDYMEYIHTLAENDIARAVKLRDLEHNSKITRLKGIRDKDVLRIKKYNTAYLYLKNYEKSI